MSLPFKALQPFDPRVVDVPYQATTLPCVPQDVSDLTDEPDEGDDEI